MKQNVVDNLSAEAISSLSHLVRISSPLLMPSSWTLNGVLWTDYRRLPLTSHWLFIFLYSEHSRRYNTSIILHSFSGPSNRAF